VQIRLSPSWRFDFPPFWFWAGCLASICRSPDAVVRCLEAASGESWQESFGLYCVLSLLSAVALLRHVDLPIRLGSVVFGASSPTPLVFPFCSSSFLGRR